DHGLPARLADQHEISGIDRHAEMLDLTADDLDRRWNYVTAIGNSRGAEHDRQFGSGFEQLIDRARKRRLLVWYAFFRDDACAGRGNTSGGDLQRLLDDLRRQTRQ